MKKYTSEEIQNTSSEFRSVARRLSRTDYSQCDSNLKRFLLLIDSNDLILHFVNEHNTCKYDIANILQKRERCAPFDVSPDFNEEISLSVQLLKYSAEKFGGDFTRLYGTYWYTSTNTTTIDEMRKFIEHIIDPLIDYIGEYLRKCYENAIREEKKLKLADKPSFTAHNSTVVIGSRVEGNITTSVIISERTKNEATELILAIKELLEKETLTNNEDIKEVLTQIQDEVLVNQKPKRGLLVALKTLCVGGATVIPLVTALIELLS